MILKSMVHEQRKIYRSGMRTAPIESFPKGNTRNHGRQRLNNAKRHRKILLAEDDLEMRSLLSTTLRKEGYMVVEVGDGYQLVETLANGMLQEPFHDVDVLLSDVRMPGYSGLEVLVSLHLAGWHLPTIIMTAFGSEELVREAYQLGANHVLQKPFDLTELTQTLYTLAPTAA